MNNIIFEDAKVIFPNFGGLEGRYNRAGNRCFSVMVTDQNGNPDTELAMQLKDEGWNIKEFQLSKTDCIFIFEKPDNIY